MSNKAEKRGLVPKLRFPEFREAGEWMPKPIGSVCNTYSGGTPATTQKEFYGGDIPFIRSAEIGKEKTELFLTPEGLFNSAAKLVAKGDVLVALYGANSGDVALARIDGAINQAILCLKSKDSNAFIYQYLSHIKNWIISTYIQGGQGNLSGEIVKTIELCFSTPKEQQKIADCLASLDKRITLEAQKLDMLNIHKKGLMQQLFPAEGETLPKLRFAEFRDAGEWEEKKLTDTITPVIREVAKPDSRYLALGLRSHGKGTFHKPDQAPEKNSMDKLYLVHHNDLIVNITFAWEGAIAIAGKQDHGCYVSHRFPTYVFNEKVSTPGFFRYVIIKKAFVYKLGLISPGGAGRNRVMNKKDLLQLTVLLPDTKEQQKIADCLASLDDLITAQTQKLAALKIYKKGLMQQLFPALDEVAA